MDGVRDSPTSLVCSDTVYSNTVRLDVHLNEPDDSSYNSISYAKLLNLELGKDVASSDLIGLTTEDTFDRFKDYQEESYIDNTEVYRDTFPAGKEPELCGFYVNTGKLKLKSSLVESNSVDKSEEKKTSVKTKAVRVKTVPKKESNRSKGKNSKHESMKISVNNKMHSNIRLDTLLQTVRKQKKNSFVKNIKTSNSSVTSASIKAKEICKITRKKNDRSTKKCAETSVTDKLILNSREGTIPIDFLSSKTDYSHPFSSTSDSDEVEILKEIVHSAYKNSNEHNFVKNNLPLKTAMPSQPVQVATEKDMLLAKDMLLPSNNIAAESTSVKSSLPPKMAIPSNSCKTIISKETFSKICRPSDAILPLPSLSTTILKELPRSSPNSNFVSSSPILDTKRASSTASLTAVPEKVFQTSSQVAADPDFITITPISKTTKSLSSPKPTISKNKNPKRKVTTDYTFTIKSSMPNMAMHSSSSKTTIHKKEFHSSCVYRTKPALFQDVPLNRHKSKSKAIVKSVHSSSSKATISPVHSSKATITPAYSSKAAITSVNSSKAPITAVHSSKATITPVLSSKATITPVHSSKTTITPVHSSKATIPKESLSSGEFAMPTGSILVNNKDSCQANTCDDLTVNFTSPKDISKYMLDLIHDNKSKKAPNSISVCPFNTQDDFFHSENVLHSNINSFRTYSKANKNSFQPIMKINLVDTSSIAVSESMQAAVTNSTHSSCITTAVNMYKMNISPVVKYKEPDSKF